MLSFQAPPTVNFPKGADKGELYTVSRVAIPDLSDPGVCLSNLKDFVPDDMKTEVKQITQTIQKVLAWVEGRK